MIFDEINFPDLPESWTSLLVEDACDNVSVQEKTKTDKYLKSGNLAVVDQGASLIGGYINEDKSVKTELPVIVFGDHTRAIKYIDFPFAAGADGIKVLRPKKIYQPRLFYYFLRAIKLPNKGYARHFQYLRSSQIALPPLDEQKHIAEKLDTLLTRVDSCQTHLERVPQILKRFRQSVLAAATSGCLTEDWRNSQPTQEAALDYEQAESPDSSIDIPENWIWVSVGNLATKVSDGVHKKPDYKASGVPFLTVKNMTAGSGLDFSDTKFVTQADHEEFCKRTLPEKDDILVSKDGTLGVIRLVDTDIPFSIFVSIALIKLKDKRFSKYVRYAMEAPVLQKQMVGVGSGLQHIHLVDLRQDVVPLPPLNEQTELVRRVEKLFAYAERLEARYTSASEHVERLTPSLLAKAFRGELVEQDADDESAEELVEMVRKGRKE